MKNKHSPPSGVRICARWRLSADERRVLLVWRESGGPTVTKPSRVGFGAKLVTTALKTENVGGAELRYRPHGLVCRMELLRA